ncbi:vif protein [Simian immunodeficiency virus]|uniref:Vif protein n=1 Tax=Simian immunodeficiency virus TaxID=11723 RepID=Q8JAH0_SIV|nr:vif protein [Simian immunodeficiency virus]
MERQRQKMWVVQPIQIMTERKVDWLLRATKHHIWSGKTPFVYVHHYQLQHQRFTQNKIRLAMDTRKVGEEVEATYIEITILWDTTSHGPASLSRSTYYQQAVIIEWVYNRSKLGAREGDIIWYSTNLTPGVAMQIIHGKYFPCFQNEDIRRAIRGEQILGNCEHPEAHLQVGTPQTLEQLAFFAYVKHYGKNPTQSSYALAQPKGAHNHGYRSKRSVGNKRGGRETLLKGRAPWNLA